MPARLNVKFGTGIFAFDRIVVTTQYPLDIICGYDEQLIAAFKERFIFATVERVE